MIGYFRTLGDRHLLNIAHFPKTLAGQIKPVLFFKLEELGRTISARIMTRLENRRPPASEHITFAQRPSEPWRRRRSGSPACAAPRRRTTGFGRTGMYRA